MPLNISVLGTGSMVPGDPVSSETLDAQLGFETGYLARTTGVRHRHYAGAASQIDMGMAAARQALDEAGIGPDELDLVVSASGIPFQALPSTAPLYMRELGVPDGRAAGYDVNSSCASFLSALDMAARQISDGVCRYVLIVSSEVASRGLPWKDQPDVAALFGDGAAAAVIGPSDTTEQGVLLSRMISYPSEFEACQVGAGGTRFDIHKNPDEFRDHAVFRMHGLKLFRITLKYFPGFVDELLTSVGWRADEVDAVIPHQASPHALEHMSRHLGFGQGRIMDLVRGIGNQVAASIPTALDTARREGHIKPGSRVLLLGTSAGVSFGGMAIQV